MSDPNQELVVSYLTMRKAVGWLGMLLPFILLFGNYGINHLDILNNTICVQKCDATYKYAANHSFKSSISHYYYSTVGELFTGTLSAVALFMFCYRGHKKRADEKGLSDSLLTNLAGLFALGVVIFPTSANECITDNIRTFLSGKHIGQIHLTFAALFFIALAVMSINNFRRSETIGDFGKGKNDNFYLLCGIIMLVCIVVIALYSFFLEDNFPGLVKLHIVFVFETIALIFFGLSWLTKGGVDFYFIPKLLKLMK